MADDLWFERLGDEGRLEPQEHAPARLKSKVYSALVASMAETGPLLDLTITKEAGGHLCVFENSVALLPVAALRSMNPCRVCHARVMGERMAHAPIFWPGCPYSEFHKG